MIYFENSIFIPCVVQQQSAGKNLYLCNNKIMIARTQEIVTLSTLRQLFSQEEFHVH